MRNIHRSEFVNTTDCQHKNPKIWKQHLEIFWRYRNRDEVVLFEFRLGGSSLVKVSGYKGDLKGFFEGSWEEFAWGRYSEYWDQWYPPVNPEHMGLPAEVEVLDAVWIFDPLKVIEHFKILEEKISRRNLQIAAFRKNQKPKDS